MKSTTICLDPVKRPETCAAIPTTDREWLDVYKNLLAQHGLKVEDVTHKDNNDTKRRWYALVKEKE